MVHFQTFAAKKEMQQGTIKWQKVPTYSSRDKTFQANHDKIPSKATSSLKKYKPYFNI